jgi:uncharacterized protein YndB with AHSA1/START domain
MAAATEALPELTFTRIFDAPRELVFKVWTDPFHVAQWWGPHGFKIPLSKVDARVGGRFEVHMQGDDGILLPSVGEFREVIAPERIVFTSNLEGPDGRKLIEAVNTVSLDDDGGRTKMTLHVKVVHAEPEIADKLAGLEAGWTQSLERLEAEVVRQARQPTER